MKFVIVGAPRTGTTMFLVTLNTLEQFDVYGELLGMHNKNPVPHPQKYIEDQRVKTFNAASKKNNMNMNKFLNFIFNNKKHVGFKLLYQHAIRLPQAVKYIQNPENNIYSVHLKRKNPVKRAISGRLNKFHHYGTGNNSVNPRGVLKSTKDGEKWDRHIYKMFGGDKYMSMYFEDFTKDTNADVMDFTEVFDFFGLDINPMVKVPTKKYGPDKLIDRVGNYGELYNYFKKNAPEYLKYVEE